MKRILLAAATAAGVMSLSAQTNFVKNGDFEAEGFEQTTPHDWDDTHTFLTNLPGWTLKGLDPWSVLAGLVPVEIDEEYTFEGNKNCLHIYRFDDNGWQAGSVSQEVTGLTPGQTYTLGFIAARAGGETVDWDDPYFLVSLEAANASGEYTHADYLISDKDDAICSADVWEPYEKTFTAPASGKVMLTFEHNNTKWEGNHSEGFWMDVDDVAIMTPEDYKAYFDAKGDNAGIEAVGSEADVETLGVYTLSGIRVANSVDGLGDAKGIYVVRTNKGANKIVR